MPDFSAATEFDHTKERRRLPLIGLAISAAYLVMLIIYLIVQQQNPARPAPQRIGRFSRRSGEPARLLVAGAWPFSAKP